MSEKIETETDIARLEAAVDKCAERDKRLTESLLLIAAALLTAAKPDGDIRVIEIDRAEFVANIHRVADHLQIPPERVVGIGNEFFADVTTLMAKNLKIAVTPDSFYPL
jgi:hypothetical protein